MAYPYNNNEVRKNLGLGANINMGILRQGRALTGPSGPKLNLPNLNSPTLPQGGRAVSLPTAQPTQSFDPTNRVMYESDYLRVLSDKEKASKEKASKEKALNEEALKKNAPPPPSSFDTIFSLPNSSADLKSNLEKLKLLGLLRGPQPMPTSKGPQPMPTSKGPTPRQVALLKLLQPKIR